MTIMVEMDAAQQYCLRWKYHHSNLQAMFSQLLERECLCDVTLACEGKTLKAHKVMLSACSTYFDSIFSQYEENNPIVILKDVRFSDIKALVQFMYRGEINVDNSDLTTLLKTAEELRIKGLAEVSWRSDNEMEEDDSGDDDLPPPPKKAKSEPLPPKIIPPTAAAERSLPDECKDSPEDSAAEDEMDDSDTGDSFRESGRNRSDSISHYEESKSKDDDVSPPSSVVPSSKVSVPTTVASPPPPIPTSSGSVTVSIVDDDKNNSTSTVPTTPFSDTSSNTFDLSQFPDVMKMNDYLDSGGRRPQFWEEPFTKRLMEAIKNKELEMKVAAELMGVSYGTLYGRYRDAYGCLKHPYRVRDFWSEQGPAEVLAKLQRKELTLFRAAELLNVTVTTLANYLTTLRQGPNSASDNEDAGTTDNEEADDDDDEKYSLTIPENNHHHNVDAVGFIKREKNAPNVNGGS